jgi:hypothetical protein
MSHIWLEVRQENNFSLRILPGSSSDQLQLISSSPSTLAKETLYSEFRVWSLGLEFWVGVK